jgi:hypothetical protein
MGKFLKTKKTGKRKVSHARVGEFQEAFARS